MVALKQLPTSLRRMVLTTELSSEAKAVKEAFFADWEDEPRLQDLRCLAAAIRVLAFEVVEPNFPSFDALDCYDHRLRNELAAAMIQVAEELEARPNG